VPVTYADVWEYWLKNRELAQDVDVVTIHILPYWEDEPVSAADSAAHVANIYRQVAKVFPGKPLLIGETGYPSQGRMRGPARPTPANQARVLTDIVRWARTAHVDVNYIEAFDQPWKRYLEGTVGGYWGLLDADARQPKFTWGVPLSNHPDWLWRMFGGWALAACAFGAAAFMARRKGVAPATTVWAGVGALATVSGVAIGLAFEYWLLGVRDIAEEVQAGIALGIAILLPIGAAALLAHSRAPAALMRLFAAPPALRRLSWWTGLLAAALTVESLELALGLVFDPRYRGFPASSLAGPVAALLLITITTWRRRTSGMAERVFAVLLAVSAAVIVVQEGVQNFEALAYAACILILAGTLAAAPSAPAPAAED
jgi:hypothetical protein